MYNSGYKSPPKNKVNGPCSPKKLGHPVLSLYLSFFIRRRRPSWGYPWTLLRLDLGTHVYIKKYFNFIKFFKNKKTCALRLHFTKIMWKWLQGCRNSEEEMTVWLNKSRQTLLGSWHSVCWIWTGEEDKKGTTEDWRQREHQCWSWNDGTWCWETDHAEQRACTMSTSWNTSGKIETLKYWVTSKHPALITLPNT